MYSRPELFGGAIASPYFDARVLNTGDAEDRIAEGSASRIVRRIENAKAAAVATGRAVSTGPLETIGEKLSPRVLVALALIAAVLIAWAVFK